LTEQQDGKASLFYDSFGAANETKTKWQKIFHHKIAPFHFIAISFDNCMNIA